MANFVVADVETSGLDPAQGAGIMEFAYVTHTPGQPLRHWSGYVEHPGKIPAAAKAVHHITEDKVQPGAPGCVPRAEIAATLGAMDPDTIFVFHNKAFDLKFLPELQHRPVVCSYRCALHLYPELGSFSLQALRYELDLDVPADLLAGLSPHAALYDSLVCTYLLMHMLKTHTAEELLELSDKPAILNKCRFGRYRGEKWSDVPKDYLRWLLRNGDFDADVLATARYWLNGGTEHAA
jgi:exodeoxyribonuclease X